MREDAQHDAVGMAPGADVVDVDQIAAEPEQPRHGQRVLVRLAVLSLLSDASERRPLLCVVDDAQMGVAPRSGRPRSCNGLGRNEQALAAAQACTRSAVRARLRCGTCPAGLPHAGAAGNSTRGSKQQLALGIGVHGIGLCPGSIPSSWASPKNAARTASAIPATGGRHDGFRLSFDYEHA